MKNSRAHRIKKRTVPCAEFGCLKFLIKTNDEDIILSIHLCHQKKNFYDTNTYNV